MSDRMKVLSFEQLLGRMIHELERQNSIFGIPAARFFRPSSDPKSSSRFSLFGHQVDTPFGPAAGPHTQLAQNIICAFLTGGRCIELKTVQEMDNLEIEKPCIEVPDEGYNTEWSQELSLDQSAEEYIKAWVLIHLLNDFLRLSDSGASAGSLPPPGVLFNMSVGYDLEGISSQKMKRFLGRMLAPQGEIEGFLEIVRHRFPRMPVPSVRPEIVHSVTISTMHGCPPSQIEAMARFLMEEKGLDTYVKLNPTLLGKEKTSRILQELGYGYIRIDDATFDKDLQYTDAVKLIRNLKELERRSGRRFGIKLSNTLANRNISGTLPGQERYMSGRALFPITISLAHKLASEFHGKISISFSGGVSVLNMGEILSTGICPVTMTTDLLKPGGYLRLSQIAGEFQRWNGCAPRQEGRIDLAKLNSLAQNALVDPLYRKNSGKPSSIKVTTKLDYFDCITAPCVSTCPIHQDIPEYIGALEEGDPSRALAVILKKNPLPGITGYICDHTCVERCVRWDYDNPIHIRDLKRTAFERGDREKAAALLREERTRKKRASRVAILGGGPAGLAVSFFLAREGMGVRIFERSGSAGGTVRNAIPRFRLPDEVIEEDLRFVRALGVDISTGWKGEFSIESLKTEGFDYIVLSTGSTAPRRLKINSRGVGEGFYTGIEFLRQVKRGERLYVGRRVAVIGGGNSAVDAARAALRFGPEIVRIIYRRDMASMPADREEVEACQEEGIQILALLSPQELVVEDGVIRGVKCLRTRLGAQDTSGRPRPVPIQGSEELFEADTIIAAVGEEVETEVLKRNGIALNERGGVLVNAETGETHIHNVYAAGDCVRGPATVVEAIADAKKVALSILQKEKRCPPESLAAVHYKETTDQRLEGFLETHGNVSPFYPVKKLPLDQRDSFETVIKALDEDDAVRESARCLRCSTVCNRCVETCPNRANVAIRFRPVRLVLPVIGGRGAGEPFAGGPGEPSGGNTGGPSVHGELEIKQSTQILHIDDFCNECGNCETFCPHQGAPYRDKLTLFSDRELFENSENSGFFPLPVEREESFSFGCRIGKIRFDLELGGERGALRFLSNDWELVLEPDCSGTALELKGFSGLGGRPGASARPSEHREDAESAGLHESAGYLVSADMAAMVGLALLIGVVIDEYPYLLK